METEINNPLLPGEKRLPDFKRYAINVNGEIRNILTGNLVAVDAEKNKHRLVDNDGQRKWFKVTPEFITTIFAPPVPAVEPEDNFNKEIIPTGSAYVAGPNIDENGNNVGEHNHHAPKAKNSKKGLSEQDIRDLRNSIANGSLTFKSAGEKYGINLEHARRIYKRQYFPNVA